MKEFKIKALWVAAHVLLPPAAVIFTAGYALRDGFKATVQEAKSAWRDCWGDVQEFRKESFATYRQRWIESEEKDEAVLQEEA